MTFIRSLGHLPPIDLAGVTTPRLCDYFAEWMIQPEQFRSLSGAASAMNLRQHAASGEPGSHLDGRIRMVAGGPFERSVCIIPVTGLLMKQRSSMTESTSVVDLKRAVRAAARDDEVGAIVLDIDSPGGTVAGTFEAVDEIWAARAAKPVLAFARDLTASAAYALASQADAIYANVDTALVGSIGVVLGLYDFSEKFSREGVEAIVFATGPLKGAGFPGSKITKEQREYLQARTDGMQEAFNAAVMRGRGMTRAQLAEVTTGAVWLPAQAQSLNLIDGVKEFDAVIREAFERAASFKENTSMPKSNTPPLAAADAPESVASTHAQDIGEPSESTASAADPALPTEPAAEPSAPEAPAAAATLPELKAALGQSDAAFREQCIEAGRTIEQAKDAWIATCEAKVEALEKRNAELLKATEVLRGHEGVDAQTEQRPGDSSAAGHTHGALRPGLARFVAALKLPSPN